MECLVAYLYAIFLHSIMWVLCWRTGLGQLTAYAHIFTIVCMTKLKVQVQSGNSGLPLSSDIPVMLQKE